MGDLVLRQPDDWHCHLRDGERLKRTVVDQARQFKRSIVMPNLVPPVMSLIDAAQYRDRILAQVPAGEHFEPLMTLYLNEQLDIEDLKKAKSVDWLQAVKYYPQGATTHSDKGVSSLEAIYPLLDQMQASDIVLAVHGESINPMTDIFDREAEFLTTILQPILWDFPRLRVVLEHISTKKAVDFVKHGPSTLAATITPHHLLLNRNDLLSGGLKPHHYCLPIVKRRQDQAALIQAAISGHPRFFLGTDSAPHAVGDKQSACGCAGIYSAHAALELYAEVFLAQDALSYLNDFASVFGPEFYGLELNSAEVVLERKPWAVPDVLQFGDTQVVPFYAGKLLQFKRV